MGETQARNWQQSWEHTSNPTKDRREADRQPRVQEQVNKRWVTPGEKIIYALFSFVTVIALVFVVSFSSNTDTLNREVQKLESSVNQQEAVNQNLSYKVKEFSNPDRILRIAKENGLKIQNTKIKQASSISN